MDYQKTVNLPQTDFAMKAGLAQKEPQFLAKWEQEGLYSKIRVKSRGKKSFVLHDGPPYANGHIHIGHALNKILKDMIVKAKTMQGMDALYVPGWDCHGLPIEHQLFKDLKKRKGEVDTVDFRKKAHEYAMKFVGVQREEFQRLGVFGQWDNPYLTLSPEYEYWILKSFAALTEKGYVYRGLKPVNWCPTCETALAEAEVEYEDHVSPSVYVKFKVKSPEAVKGLPAGKPVYLVIWTTTPWTLLANVAVAAHPAYEYAVIDDGKEILIMESALSASVLAKGGVTEFKVPAKLTGAQLKGLTYEHPFGAKASCRVINTDYVTKEDGTGLVHTAPGHGQEDFQAGLANGLEVLMPVDDRGIFTADAGNFAGQYVFKANEHIVADLQSRGILFKSENLSHSYPHCWRCKKPVIFRATKQWFLKIDHNGLREKLKEVIVNKVQWIPPAGQERILGMVNTRPDWCLSRQRHWGVPIPALVCKGCKGEHKLFTEVINRLADLAKVSGTDVWFEKNLAEFLPAGFKCPDCGGADFEKTHDILDVWFDSGVSHRAVVGPMLKKELPADLYLEGSDQHRGWFQSSLIPSTALDGQAPFKAVLTHGFVVDGQGRKMSKSLGNVIAPQDVVKNNGVDILRLWVASSSYHDDIRLSKEILDRLIDAYRKIRNTFRYLLGNLHGFDPDQHSVAYAELLDVDKWALARLAQAARAVQAAYNEYEFAKVYKIIYAFCNEDLSSFYLDILKDRLYTSAAVSPQRRSAQTVLYQIADNLVRLLAPILTFTAEEIFASMPKGSADKNVLSIHLAEWRDVPAQWDNPAVGEKYRRLIEFRPLVLKALEDRRGEGLIGSSLEAKVVIETASPRDLEYFQGLLPELPALFIVSQVEARSVGEVEQGVNENFSRTRIIVEKAAGTKCPRCWNYREDIGQDAEHKELCARCSQAIQNR